MDLGERAQKSDLCGRKTLAERKTGGGRLRGKCWSSRWTSVKLTPLRREPMKTTRTLMMALVCACCMCAISATALAQDGSPTSCPDPSSSPFLADLQILGGSGSVGLSYPYASYLFYRESGVPTPPDLELIGPGVLSSGNGLYYPDARLLIDPPRFGSLLLNTGKAWMKFAHANWPDMRVSFFDSSGQLIHGKRSRGNKGMVVNGASSGAC